MGALTQYKGNRCYSQGANADERRKRGKGVKPAVKARLFAGIAHPGRSDLAVRAGPRNTAKGRSASPRGEEGTSVGILAKQVGAGLVGLAGPKM